MAHFKDYRPDIDGLRAIAVLSVVIFHAFPHGALRGGFTGVDVFFVISGYLISLIIIKELKSGTYSTLAFYRRRILRIFPALLTVLTACLAVGWTALLPDEFLQLAKHAAGSGAFLVNFMLWGEIGYFDSAADLKPLLHLWSLGIEEQFYIVWPLLLLAAHKLKGSLFKWATLVAAVSFGFSIYCLFFDRSAAFYNPVARTWELTAGSMAAIMVHRGYKPKAGWQADAMSILGIALIVTGFFAVKQSSSFPGFKALLPVVGACLVILAGRAGLLNRTVLSSKPAVWIGLISYPLYLWHWPILAFLRIGQADGTYQDVTLEIRALAVIAAILLAWATYVFIEKPIRFGAQRQYFSKALAPAMVCIVAFGIYVYRHDGIPGRIAMHPESAQVLFSEYPHPTFNDDCRKHYPQLKDAWCLLSKDKPADIAIVGDSHANQYYLSLAKFLPNLSVLNISQPGCLPFSALDGCEQKVSAALQTLIESPQIKTIIFTGYFSYLEADFRFGNVEGRRVAGEASIEATQKFKAAANKSIGAMVGVGKGLILLEDIPDLVFRPRECVSFDNPLMSALRGTKTNRPLEECGVKTSEFMDRIGDHHDRLRGILSAYPEVKTYNPKPLFCDDDLCKAYSDGEFDYWNSDHLTIAGADKVVQGLLTNPHIITVFDHELPLAMAK